MNVGRSVRSKAINVFNRSLVIVEERPFKRGFGECVRTRYSDVQWHKDDRI